MEIRIQNMIRKINPTAMGVNVNAAARVDVDVSFLLGRRAKEERKTFTLLSNRSSVFSLLWDEAVFFIIVVL